jgi:hypothetical protein
VGAIATIVGNQSIGIRELAQPVGQFPGCPLSFTDPLVIKAGVGTALETESSAQLISPPIHRDPARRTSSLDNYNRIVNTRWLRRIIPAMLGVAILILEFAFPSQRKTVQLALLIVAVLWAIFRVRIYMEMTRGMIIGIITAGMPRRS